MNLLSRNSLPLWLTLLVLQMALGLLVVSAPLQVTLLLVSLTLFTILFIVNIKWGIYLLFPLIPIGENFAGFTFDQSWSTADTLVPLLAPFLVVVLTIDAFTKLAKVRQAKVRSGFTPIMALLLGWGFLSLFWAVNIPHYLIKYALLILYVFLFHYYLNALDSEKIYRSIMPSWITIGVLVALIAVISLYYEDRQTFTFPIVDKVDLVVYIKHHAVRALGITNPNATALILNLCSAITFGYFLRSTGKDNLHTLLLCGALLLLLYANLATGSKGGLLSLLGMIFFLLLVVRRLRKNFLRNSCIALGAIIMVLVIQTMLSPVESRVIATSTTSSGAATSFSFSSRLEMWRLGFSSLVRESGGFGLGVGGFSAHLDPHPHAHNIYFSLLFDFGYVGVVAMLLAALLLWKYFKIAWKYQETYLQTMLIVLMAGGVAVCIHGLVDHTYGKAFLWLYLAFCAATYNLVRKEIQPLNQPDGLPQS